jgi:hypothetical protein
MEYLTTPYHETDLGDITTTKPEQDLILPLLLEIRTLDMGSACLVNRNWYVACDSPLVWKHHTEKNLEQAASLAKQIDEGIFLVATLDKKNDKEMKGRIEKIQRDMKGNLDYRPDDTRLDYLLNTNLHIKNYLQQSAVIKKRLSTKAYNVVLALLTDMMESTVNILGQIARKEMEMTINFDILELSLRRLLTQLVEMFPLKGDPKTMAIVETPSLIISDPKACAIWELTVGKNTHFCSFRYFYKNVVRKLLQKHIKKDSADSGRVDSFFVYLLNFPQDNVVTTYKWHVFVSLFGPMEKFFDNFEKYIMGRGFCGFINRLYATQLLKDHPKHLLIRFSRTEPTSLAISYYDPKSKSIVHSLNGASWWQSVSTEEKHKLGSMFNFSKSNVPLDILLNIVFPSTTYPLVPMTVDTQQVLVASKSGGLEEYIRSGCGYLH